MYVRSKQIKGQTYFYLVKSERHGKQVTQKYIGYLGKAGGRKQTIHTERASLERTPPGLEALAREARKYTRAEEFVQKLRKGVVVNSESLPAMLRSPMDELEEARQSGTFQAIERAKKLVEKNIEALNRDLKRKPFAPFYLLNDKGKGEFHASDTTTIPKGIYEPKILGRRVSDIKPREVKEFTSKIEQQIRQRAINPHVGAERIQLLEEIRSGETLTDFYHQVRQKMNGS